MATMRVLQDCIVARRGAIRVARWGWGGEQAAEKRKMTSDDSAGQPASTFMVITAPSRDWKKGEPVWNQPFWHEHADFVNAMHADGQLYMAGPLRDHSRMFIILQGEERVARARQLQDPWILHDVTRLVSFELWDVLMDPRTGYAWKRPE
jgi:uncharacterized protein YciI